MARVLSYEDREMPYIHVWALDDFKPGKEEVVMLILDTSCRMSIAEARTLVGDLNVAILEARTKREDRAREELQQWAAPKQAPNSAS